jgi:hypothetical protein
LFLPSEPANDELRFFARALELLTRAGVPFMVGGMYALLHYAGISRSTKDLDVFVEKKNVAAALRAFGAGGLVTEITAPHWLAKARSGESFVDIIFNSGNGESPVDAVWFERAAHAMLLGIPALVCPVEETIWSKAFVQERERYDGADVTHLIRAQGERLDWRHLVERFGDSYRVLLAHLVLFGFAYPGEKACVPDWVMRELLDRLGNEPSGDAGVCRGTLLSREQYLVDVERGLRDARLTPTGSMTQREIDLWTPPPQARR